MVEARFNPDIILSPREMQACFLIAFNNVTGTAFLYGDENGKVFITAAHTMLGARAGDSALLKTDTGWHSLGLTGIWFDPNGLDICAFAASNFAVKGKDKMLVGGEVFPGEPLKFLGFPHGLSGTYPGQGLPTPLVRNAFFSGVIEVDGNHLMVLDGFNNPGFSGGPVYASEDGKPALFGIISSYRPERESHSRIYRRDEQGKEMALPDLYTKPNSGLIISVAFKRVQERIMPLVTAFLPWHEGAEAEI